MGYYFILFIPHFKDGIFDTLDVFFFIQSLFYI